MVDTVAVFELRGSIAHYRRPDTLATHASYPVMPRTVLRGLVASVLGRGDLPAGERAGLRLLAPVRTVAQELSLHGKTWEARSGKPDSFHRPISVELVVQPHYRVYYAGPLAGDLADMLAANRSHYHTYLGSAYCLTVPKWLGTFETADVPVGPLECVTVVPAPAAGRLVPEEGRQYSRVGGVLWEHVGPFADRRFRGSVAVLYETAGRPITLEPADPDPRWQFVDVPGEGVVCLW